MRHGMTRSWSLILSTCGLLAIGWTLVVLNKEDQAQDLLGLTTGSRVEKTESRRADWELPASSKEVVQREPVVEIDPLRPGAEEAAIQVPPENPPVPPRASALTGRVVDGQGALLDSFTVVFTSPAAVQTVRRFGPDASGKFSFDSEEDGRWSLTAQAEGFLTTRMAFRFPSPEPLVVQLKRAGEVTVLLVGQQGDPIGSARVKLEPMGHERTTGVSMGFTDSLGEVRLTSVDPGSYRVIAYSGAYGHGFHPAIEISESAPQARVEIQLSPGGEIRGTVFGHGDAEVPKFPLQLQRQSQDSADPYANFKRSRRSDSDGTFEFSGLPPGEYVLSADPSRTGSSSFPRRELEVRVTEQQCTFTDLYLVETTGIRVRCQVTRGGEPVPDASVSVFQHGERKSERFQEARADEHGTFELALDSAGTWIFYIGTLGVSGSNIGIQVVAEIPPIREHELTFELPTGGIRGRVEDSDGNGVASIRVKAQGRALAGNGGPLGAHSMIVTADDGSFVLDNLPPGSYRVSAWGSGQSGTYKTSRRTPEVDVVVQSANSFADVVLRLEDRGLGSLSGKLIDADGQSVLGAEVLVRRADSEPLVFNWGGVEFDSVGGYWINDLAAGSCLVRASKDSLVSAWTQVEVKAGVDSRVDLLLSPGATLQVVVHGSIDEDEMVFVFVLDPSGRVRAAVPHKEETMKLGPLSPGDVEVVARRLHKTSTGVDGHEGVRKSIKLESGGTHQVTLQLE